MSYWNDFRNKFVRNNHENIEKLKDLGHFLYDKTREGGSKIAEMTKEEIEVLKLKHQLHKKHDDLTETVQKIGDLYLDIHKGQPSASLSAELQKNVKAALELENECKTLEGVLKNKDADSSLNWDEYKEPVSTPY